MKRILAIFMVALVMVTTYQPITYASGFEYYISDNIGYFSSAEMILLEQKIGEIEHDTKIQVIVKVTDKSVQNPDFMTVNNYAQTWTPSGNGTIVFWLVRDTVNKKMIRWTAMSDTASIQVVDSQVNGFENASGINYYEDYTANNFLLVLQKLKKSLINNNLASDVFDYTESGLASWASAKLPLGTYRNTDGINGNVVSRTFSAKPVGGGGGTEQPPGGSQEQPESPAGRTDKVYRVWQKGEYIEFGTNEVGRNDSGDWQITFIAKENIDVSTMTNMSNYWQLGYKNADTSYTKVNPTSINKVVINGSPTQDTYYRYDLIYKSSTYNGLRTRQWVFGCMATKITLYGVYSVGANVGLNYLTGGAQYFIDGTILDWKSWYPYTVKYPLVWNPANAIPLPIDEPVPYPGEDGTGGTGGGGSSGGGDTSGGNDGGGTGTVNPPTDLIGGLQGGLTGRLPVLPLRQSLQRLQELSQADYHTLAPKFTLNLNTLLNSAVHEIAPELENSLDEEITYFDVSPLNTVQFQGIPLIDYFRGLVSAGMIFMTAWHIWRRIVPQETISS